MGMLNPHHNRTYLL